MPADIYQFDGTGQGGTRAVWRALCVEEYPATRSATGFVTSADKQYTH